MVINWDTATVRNEGAGLRDPHFDEAVTTYRGQTVQLDGAKWQCVGLIKTPRNILEGPAMAISKLGRKLWFGRLYLLLSGEDGAQMMTTIHGLEVVPVQATNRPA